MATDTSRSLLNRIAEALAPVRGVHAVVLGGSRARGTHHAGSDFDVGLYYRGGEGLDFAALDRAAAALNDGGASDQPLLTRFGDWGAWVDGGGWLTVDGIAVDILYRDLDRVGRVIDAVQRGEFACAYHVGHPHGFISHMYAGEIATCAALHDPEGAVAAAKARLTPYPEALRATIVARFAGEGRFFLLINEKGALAMAAKFAHAPKDFRLAAEGALAELAAGPQGMLSALKALGDLFDETDRL